MTIHVAGANSRLSGAISWSKYLLARKPGVLNRDRLLRTHAWKRQAARTAVDGASLSLHHDPRVSQALSLRQPEKNGCVAGVKAYASGRSWATQPARLMRAMYSVVPVVEHRVRHRGILVSTRTMVPREPFRGPAPRRRNLPLASRRDRPAPNDFTMVRYRHGL